jgi:hypothetical protein
MINPASELTYTENSPESSHSSVAWAAIFGGALAAAGLTLILTPLGTAFGFASVSPWHSAAPAAKALTVASIIWLLVVQWLSAGLGGYLTGRLRTKWVGAHTHEVFFRDTVHGFLSWALASAIGAVMLVSFASHMGGHGMDGHNAGSSMENHYSASLFRTDPSALTIPATPAPQAVTPEGAAAPTPATPVMQPSMQPLPPVSPQDLAEGHRVLDMSVTAGQVPDEDRAYLAQLIAARTGISQPAAQARIDDAMNREKADLDKARKASSAASFALCIALLIGAFVASVAGALGGAHRDVHYEHGTLTPLE